MPTLIRLIVILLVLVGIGYGAMFALTVFVEPREKDVTIRIPARDLVPQVERDPLVRREIDTTRPTTPAPPAEPAPVEAAPAPQGEPAGEDGVVTLQPGTE
ncbi:hypothetical protein [Devosia sp. CN2-171]|jgi:hypothetical protein|uniref:hypothetical protein n=1 Tax=Devosia sp. CN2-171 TaxID=3400909 RepID=UPI003BF8013B